MPISAVDRRKMREWPGRVASEIAAAEGMSRAGVYAAAQRLGITLKRVPAGRPKKPRRKVLDWKRCDPSLSNDKLAQMMGCHKSSVWAARKAGKLAPRKTLRGAYDFAEVDWSKTTAAAEARRLGCSKTTARRHRLIALGRGEEPRANARRDWEKRKAKRK